MYPCERKLCFAESYPEVDMQQLADAFNELTKRIFRDLILTTNLRLVSCLSLNTACSLKQKKSLFAENDCLVWDLES